jgi:hypothetical protein
LDAPRLTRAARRRAPPRRARCEQVLAEQELAELQAAAVDEADLRVEVAPVEPGPEDQVEERDVAEVAPMNAALVMHGVHLRARDHVAEPRGSAEIRVLERGEDHRDVRGEERGFGNEPDEPDEAEAGDERPSDHVDRMEVVRSEDVEALRGVVGLVKPPQNGHRVQQAMPDVRDELVGRRPSSAWAPNERSFSSNTRWEASSSSHRNGACSDASRTRCGASRSTIRSWASTSSGASVRGSSACTTWTGGR